MFLVNFYLFMIVILLFLMFLYFYMNQIIFYLEFNLMMMNSMKLEFMILLDWVSLLFLSVVIFISLMVIFYSLDYMVEDKNLNRFIYLIYLFVSSMILMVVSPNLISILLGWDGLGLVSYCLVIFYQSKKSYNSGMVTVLSNRLGDIFILLSISMMMFYGTWNYMFMMKMDNLIYFLLMLTSFTKSAQIPFSSWLPMAMAAPTPISALVHSSTLVTAGVYLLIRLNYLMSSKLLINLMMLISLMTMILAGIGANFEFDLKKIIALSTLSQLGLMIFSLSLKLMEISMFHLLMHALFKSLLFMCVGVIIHSMGGNQDIRVVSMTLINLPMISMMFNCASFSLCGIPFLSGFFSKDLILEMYLMGSFNKYIFNMLFMSMGLSVMYTIRLMYYSFIKLPQLLIYSKFNSFKGWMGISMYSLFIMSIIKGLIMSWIFFSMKMMIFLPKKLKMIIFGFMSLGMILGLILSKIFFKKKNVMYMKKMIYYFSELGMMVVLNTSLVTSMMKYSENILFKMDLGWIEYFWGLVMINFLKKIFKLDFFKKKLFNLLIIFMMILMVLLF